MRKQTLSNEIRCNIAEYLSDSTKDVRFICGAFVAARRGFLIVDHDEGWTVTVRLDGGPAVLLDYSQDQRFEGAAGVDAVMDWLP